ncbi:hypothetical protein [Streptomyces sviceus]|uniref:hypothetical protein n=1 Tax=Streptomyces sviceus TaxID=285530 RepID=UPI0036AC5D91
MAEGDGWLPCRGERLSGASEPKTAERRVRIEAADQALGAAEAAVRVLLAHWAPFIHAGV